VPEGGGVDHDGQPPLLPDGRDTAGYVAGGTLGGRDLRHDRLLAADGDGERLQVQLAVHRNHPYRERAVHRRDERLEHSLRRHTERAAGLQSVGFVPRVVDVFMQRERDLCPFKGDRRRRTASSHERPQ
jgi:hypothetical protein